ncbi:MAG: septation protein SepH [Nocardioidaceae bacterium]
MTTGTEFVAPADARLRAALRGDRARLGQLEIEMHSALRPRDIQARIRAGESPETVAAMAQVSVDKILPYCVPVLAERAHIAELARRSHVRRRGADGPARRLADVVTERLQSRSVDPASAQWEAWRRDDGRWLVQVTYSSGERERSAHFAFDPDGRYSIADDDEAKWLTGERQSSSKGPQPRDGSKLAERRLAAVPAGDDLLNLPDDDRASEVDEGTDDLTAVIRAVHESPAQREFIPDEAADESGSGAELEAPTSRRDTARGRRGARSGRVLRGRDSSGGRLRSSRSAR